jgi:hypothetical protein
MSNVRFWPIAADRSATRFASPSIVTNLGRVPKPRSLMW